MTTLKKVTIICPVHEPNDIRVYKKEALSLYGAGYDVSMIAKKSAKLIEINENIKLINLIYINRIFRFLSIPKVIFLSLKERADIYHIHNPDTLPVGLFLKICGKKVIYDTHENFHKKIILRTWIPSLIRNAVANIIFYSERILSSFFDATIVTQEEQLKDYARSCLIGNAPLKQDLKENKIAVDSLNNKINLVFLGGISEDRGLGNMINLCNEMNLIRPTQLQLIGPVINALTHEELLKIVSRHDNVFYEGVLNQEVAFDIVRKCDFGMILFNDVADYRNISPNKLFEYMMLGTPFISTDFPKWERFLGNEGVGVFTSVNKIDSNLAGKIIELKDDFSSYNAMVDLGVNFVNDKYNWVLVEEPILLELYKKVLGAR